MLALFASWFTGKASSLASYAVVGLLAAVAAVYVTHRFDNAKYEALELAQAKAQQIAVEKAAAVQAATDKIALDAAVAEAQAQQKIVVQHDVLTKEIDTYVPVHVACVTNGIVRLLNAAGIGADPTDASYAPGKPDGACAAISARDLAANIIANYTNALANAEQLNALEAWVTATVEATR